MPDEPKMTANTTTLTGGTFGGEGGQPGFVIASNRCDSFELGRSTGEGHWLKGEVVGEGEFNFNGRLYHPHGGAAAGIILDNFPKAAPEGWIKKQRLDAEGYDLVSPTGVTIFGYRVDGGDCHVTVNIYSAQGEIVAECEGDDFTIYQGPVRIGGMLIE